MPTVRDVRLSRAATAQVAPARSSSLWVMLGLLLACSRPSREPSGEWVRQGPLEAVRRTSERDAPLSERDPAQRWQRIEALSDEFGGDTLDRRKWHGTNPDWLGGAPAFFAETNVKVTDGRLVITMRREQAPPHLRALGYGDYSSGAVKSKADVLYGYFEVRARAMASAGSSAFWFYKKSDRQWTEIDVFELWARSPTLHHHYSMNVHVFGVPDGKPHRQWNAAWIAPFDFAADYHVYGLDWTERELEFFVDGALVRRKHNEHWHQALQLNLDSEIMADYAGVPDDRDLPSHFEVDYVRAWKRR